MVKQVFPSFSGSYWLFLALYSSVYILESTSQVTSFQFSSVAQSCPTLCDPMNRSTPGLPVHHQLPEFTQTHVHLVTDVIQPSKLHTHVQILLECIEFIYQFVKNQYLYDIESLPKNMIYHSMDTDLQYLSIKFDNFLHTGVYCIKYFVSYIPRFLVFFPASVISFISSLYFLTHFSPYVKNAVHLIQIY